MNEFLNDRRVEIPLQAFLIGRADRTNGRPLTGITAFVDGILHYEEDWDFWDGEVGRQINVAYYAGYDPNNDLGLVLPEFIDEAAALARSLFQEAGLRFPEPNEPVSACERTESACNAGSACKLAVKQADLRNR